MDTNLLELAQVLVNDQAARQPGVDKPLYSLQNVVAGDWDYSYPTLHSSTSSLLRNKLLTSDKEFSVAFKEKYPFLAKIDWNNIMIAGGSVAAILLQRSWGNDVDVFIYGLNEEQADKKVVSLLEQIIEANRENIAQEYQEKNPGEITEKKHRELIAKADEDLVMIRSKRWVSLEIGRNKVEIIFRLYADSAEILYGFDLGSCAAGYNGLQVFFTGLGKYCFDHLINIVDPSRRSTTYEYRLKKYFSRGFHVVLPDLEMCKLKRDYFAYGMREVAQLPHMPFSYSRIKDNKIMDVAILKPPKEGGCLFANPPQSDYSDVDGEEVDEFKIFYLNLKNLAKGGDEYYYYSSRANVDGFLSSAPYISPGRIIDYYDGLAEKIFDGRSVDLGRFLSYFSPELLPGIIEGLAVKRDCSALEKLIDEQKQVILEKLQQVSKLNHAEIPWMIRNPGTQLTGSFNPVMSNPGEWYGCYLASTR